MKRSLGTLIHAVSMLFLPEANLEKIIVLKVGAGVKKKTYSVITSGSRYCITDRPLFGKEVSVKACVFIFFILERM